MQKRKLTEWLETHASNHLLTEIVKLKNTSVQTHSYDKDHFLCIISNNQINTFDSSLVLRELNQTAWFEKTFSIIGNNKPSFFIYKKEFYTNKKYLDIDYSCHLKQSLFLNFLKRHKEPSELTVQLMNYLLL